MVGWDMRSRSLLSVLCLGALGVGAGCVGLTQPSVKDIQLVENAAKAQSMQAQRTIMGLHADIQGLQRELGTARGIAAKLEGDLREAQLRLTEDGRTGSGQREELARMREERDRLSQSAAAMQEE